MNSSQIGTLSRWMDPRTGLISLPLPAGMMTMTTTTSTTTTTTMTMQQMPEHEQAQGGLVATTTLQEQQQVVFTPQQPQQIQQQEKEKVAAIPPPERGQVAEDGKIAEPVPSLRSDKQVNSFIAFSMCQRPVIHHGNPFITNIEISKVLGDLWRNLEPKERHFYQRMAFEHNRKLRAMRSSVENSLSAKRKVVTFHTPSPVTPQLDAPIAHQSPLLPQTPSPPEAHSLAKRPR